MKRPATYAGTFAHSKNQIPPGEHWAILTFSSVYIPGDERSRTNPGHGYPAHSESTIGYQAFEKEADFLEAIEEKFLQTGERDRCLGIHVTETFTYTISIKPQRNPA